MEPQDNSLPKHIGIIMDGNGRWAQKRMLPRSQGHKQGAKVFRDIAKYCNSLSVEYLTVYAFSTENWRRPKEEVDTIMDLLRDYLKEVHKHAEENGRIHFIGDISALDTDLQELIAEVEELTKDKTGMTVNIALNYGGRDEIVRAARILAQRCKDGEISPAQIDEAALESCLYTNGQPDVDCVIRPSGEQRVSNFLLWQAAYAEFVYLDVLWPDFTTKHMDIALARYNERDRRFGGI